MTLEEYKEVCNKYPDYLVCLDENDCYYINRGEITKFTAQWQIIGFKYDCDKDIIATVYPNCYFSADYNDIVTSIYPNHKTKDKDSLEYYIQMYIKNCKKLRIKLKKEEIDKDFV